jgi:hypothetical protein
MSPFLALPPELRLQIYGHLLAGNTLHCGSPGSRTHALGNKINVCAMTNSGVPSPMHTQGILAFEPIAKRPHACCTRTTLPAGLVKLSPLLFVSRQVHGESLAVLLGGNTFTFHDEGDLRAFLSKVPAAHHHLIKRVRFYTLSLYHIPWTPETNLATLLPDLTHLSAWLGISPRGVRRLRPKTLQGEETLASVSYQDRLFRHLECFRGHDLAKVEIVIDAFDHVWETGVASDLGAEGVAVWAKRVRERLMKRG